MATSNRQSGCLIQHTAGSLGNFEIVVPAPAGGLTHFWRDNDNGALPWNGPNFFNSGAWSEAALIRANWGHLEVVARQGDRLGHFWRDGAGTWQGPHFFGSGVTGDPAFIQATNGNFEVIAPRSGGGFSHFTRPNPPGVTQPWQGPFNFGSGNVQGVGLIESSFFGNLEVIACEGNQLVFYWRASDGWDGPYVIATGVSGSPGFIQSSFGSIGNFEVVVPMASGGLAHLWRDNNSIGLPWRGPFAFGSGTCTSASLIESNFGPGNFEVIAREGNRLAHYWRLNGPPWTWSGPFYFCEKAVRLHFKILTSPTSFTTGVMLANMRQVFSTAWVRVDLISTESLSLPTLTDLDVGSCDWRPTTAEQQALFSNRNNVMPNDVVIYYVNTDSLGGNGCARHPDGRPGAIVTAGASPWTLAHEVGHILGLGHVDPTDRLMMGRGTWGITNPPPDLDHGEVRAIRGHALIR